jgi:polysaccharide biosynthesis transport protein
MEFANFIKLLKRQRFIIVLVPVIAIIITYFLTKNQPNTYSSKAVLATGIVDQTQNIINEGADAQESKISQEFSNLTEMLKSKKVLDQVSYYLMIHDLTSKEPYRKPSKLLQTLNASARRHALQTYTDLYKQRDALSLFDADQNGLNVLLGSMKYDDQSLLNNLTVYRVQNSDYIEVQFDSESADLSADVVNLVCKEFIEYYTFLVKDNQRKAVDFWGSLLAAKEDSLNRRMAALKAYKIRNHVLNLNEKAKSIYGQITDFETRREEMEKNMEATQATINDIDKQFSPTDRKYIESTKVEISRQILNERDQLETLNNAYVQNNFDPKYKKQIDSLSALLSSHIEKLSDKYILNPLNAKQDLIQQKLSLQVQNDLAKNSAGAINRELDRLSKEFDGLVPHEGTIQAYESAIAVASQEYLEILGKYNQTNMVAKVSVQLRLLERAEPGAAQPSKKMLLVILSGIISFIFCIAVFFILYLFDDSVKNARELANKTRLPVLGHVNMLKNKSIDLGEIWSHSVHPEDARHFRNLMQSIRYEVDTELGNQKVVLVNSNAKGEGKTFIAINLAYAYSTINKKVLLIDGNFSNTGITGFSKSKYYLEDFLAGTIDNSFLAGNQIINVLCNKGGDISLLEVASGQQVGEKFDLLKKSFDIIIIESSALDTLNRAKEWVIFSDKILTVFEAGQSVTEPMKLQIEYLKSTGKFSGWILNLEQPENQAAESA